MCFENNFEGLYYEQVDALRIIVWIRDENLTEKFDQKILDLKSQNQIFTSAWCGKENGYDKYVINCCNMNAASEVRLFLEQCRPNPILAMPDCKETQNNVQLLFARH